MFNGQLNPNTLYNTQFNWVISEEIFGDRIRGDLHAVVDSYRVDGTMYGDTKTYLSSDALPVHDLPGTRAGIEASMAQLLSADWAPDAILDSIRMNISKQVRLTTEGWFTKQAFVSAGMFQEFQDNMLSMIGEAKKIYDATVFNAFLFSTSAKNILSYTIPAVDSTNATTIKDSYLLRSQEIAGQLEEFIQNLNDIHEAYNSNGFTRSYTVDSFFYYVPVSFKAELVKMGLPMIFHKDGLIPVERLIPIPDHYFGIVNASATPGDGTIITSSTSGKKYVEGKTIYSITPQVLTATGLDDFYVRAGQGIPTGYTAPAGTSITMVSNLHRIRIVEKGAAPYMSGFEDGAAFWIPRNNVTNHYLSWLHNTLKILDEKALIDIIFTDA